jgi:pSer/pThr/pTyr-binding forkhead associated (FHA) protein
MDVPSDDDMTETVSKSTLRKKGLWHKRKRNRNLKKYGKKRPFDNQAFGNVKEDKETIGPTSDMVMNALKGMLKSVAKGSERTKNRWQRTPETPTRPKRRRVLPNTNSSRAHYKTEKKNNPRHLVQEASRELYQLDWSGDEQDARALDFARNAEDSNDERGIILNQRAETPLVHIAWRQSHEQRAPVVELQLLGGPAQSSNSGMLSSYPDKIELKSGRTMVGRDGKVCDIMMDSARQPKMVSKVHACFWVTRQGEKWLVDISDCHSTNGTFVNGKRVSARHGRKRINVGNTVMFGRRSRKEKSRSELLYLLTENRSALQQQIMLSKQDSMNVERTEDSSLSATNDVTLKQKGQSFTFLKNRRNRVARRLNSDNQHASSRATNTMEILSPDRQSMPIQRLA